jgi:hypothetical protein
MAAPTPADLHETLSKEELDALIDREARRLLEITGEEFKKLYAAGRLPDHVAARVLSMLVDLEQEAI